MKVSNNYNVINNISIAKNNNKKYIPNQRNQSFGGFLTAIGNANKGLMNIIEKGGFFAEFCIMDMCGLVLPRVYQGFNRNKEELGHWNIQAGLEEFLREFITGPSMFLIPIGAVLLSGRLLGKATQINFNLLKRFTNVFKTTGNKIAQNSLIQNQKNFASKLFNDVFVNAKGKIANPHMKINDFRKEFVQQLTSDLGKKLSKDDIKARRQSFKKLVSNINAAFFKKENTYDVAGNHAEDLFDYARKYMEDVVHSAKLSVDEVAQTGKNVDTNSIIDKIAQIRHNGRELLCLGGTAALAAFLSIIPKIYQLSKKNPAVIGLEKEANKEEKKC